MQRIVANSRTASVSKDTARTIKLSDDFEIVTSSKDSSTEDKKEGQKSSSNELLKAILCLKSGVTTSDKLCLPGIRFSDLMSGGGRGGAPDLKVSCELATGFTVAVNSAAGKYLQFLNGATSYAIANVGSSSEFSSFGSIFDEFFVHRVEFHFHPVNRHSANAAGNAVLATAAGAPGFVNTLGATWICLQHNQSAYADAASVWANASVATSSRFVNLGDPFSVVWKNNEKFSWTTPLGDQTTTGSTQGWCNIANSAEYGGRVQLATPELSGAAAGIGTLVEGGVMGHTLVRYHVSFRARS